MSAETLPPELDPTDLPRKYIKELHLLSCADLENVYATVGGTICLVQDEEAKGEDKPLHEETMLQTA